MNYILDTHSHSIASGHAYSTILEMAMAANENGLDLISITEHAPNMPGSCHEFYFHNLRVIPETMCDVELLMGVELNIIDYKGKVDLVNNTLRTLDICIASLHPPCLPCGSKEENTSALIGAMENPYVNIIGHPDDGRYPLDYRQVVLAAKKNNVLLEINNSSLSPKSFRLNAKENVATLLNLCKEYEVFISLGSDAHIAYDLGNFTYANEIIEELNFPKDLIVNTSVQKLKDFLDRKRGMIPNQ